MAMAACYPNYDLQQTHQQQVHHQHSMVSSRLVAGQMAAAAQKDYSVPLHVDCSVEYELPNQAKPPVGARVEPLLMIHPCYFRKMESQRRSPFVNNMPNSTRSSNSIVANVVDSSNRRSSKASSQQTQQQQHVVVSNHQGSSMHHHQNLQHQIDEYMQRQMVQRSQQAHYPVGATANSQQQQQQSQLVQSQHHRHHSHQSQPQQQQLHQQQQQQQQSHLTSQQQSTNQYGMQSQQQQQLANTSDWSRYMGPDGVVRSYGKVNLANQTAYSNVGSSQNGNGSGSSTSSNSSKSKAIKRSNTGMPQQHQQNLMPVASCVAFNSSGSSLEGGLPSGPRWDIEKTSMAAVPRDFQAGPESLPIKANASLMASGASNNNNSSNGGPQTAIGSNHTNNNYQPSAAMYRNPSVVGKRDAMLSGGCGVYSNSSNNNNNNNLRNNNNTELGLTAAAVAAAGVSGLWDSAALLEKTPMAAIPRDYQAGPEHMACSKMASVGSHSLMRSSGGSSNSSSGYHTDKSSVAAAALFAGKYRQHQRASHRLHPYMMTSSMGGSFPPLMTPAFPQMQQVSCYNV